MFLLALFLGILSAPTAPATGYKVVKGPHPMERVVEVKLRDEKRGKDLAVRVTFPKETGRYPLIVFSHGMGGSKDGYLPLTEHWASHGYVVIQPTHADSLQFAKPEERRAFLQGNLNLGLGEWRSRPEDVTFLLDHLDELEKRVPGLAGKVDRQRTGVGGHSYGAHTAQLIGGVTPILPLKGPDSLRDRRVKAVLLISPQGRGGLLKEESFKALAVPAMVITGSNDRGRTGQGPDWRKDPFLLSPPDDRYLVFVEGAYHGFGGITGSRRSPIAGPANPDQVKYVQDASVAFWDAYLKAEPTAKAHLKSDELKAFSKGAVSVTTR